MQRGFSLVELSIVLVILGLLTGGILAGQSLIHAAELRKITRDANQYRTAIYTFRDKYFSIPGDLNIATKIWGKDATNCGSADGTAVTGGTCNGNADGKLSGAASGEPRFFWQHLAFAGLVNGSYTLPSTGGYYQPQLFDTQIPRSGDGNSGFVAVQTPTNLTVLSMFYPAARDRLNLVYNAAGIASTTTSSHMGFGVNLNPLKPEDAWNLDNKSDDGMPGLGKITTQRYNEGTTPVVQTCNSSIDEGLATYNVTTPTLQCSLLYLSE